MLPKFLTLWIEKTLKSNNSTDFLTPAFLTAQNLEHEEQKNEILFKRSIALYQHLLPLSDDHETIIAAILLPFFNDTPKNIRQICNEHTSGVCQLLRGTQRMKTFDNLPIESGKAQLNHNNIDSLRRLLLAIVDDIRIVILKLVERLENIESLRFESVETQKNAAKQVKYVYAPLANRLGIGQLKWQLEDWAFRYSEPETYNTISKALNQRRQDREDYIKLVYDKLNYLLQGSSISHFKLSGRAKHIYSIHRKQQRKKVSFEEIYDTNAFRILVDSVHDCYTALSLIHEKWHYIKNEFDDYVARPKQNGYKSIHTVIIGPEERNIEIQIRTNEMNQDAELGVAAHWKYKEDKQGSDSYEDKISLLRNIIHWQKETNQEKEYLYQEIFNDRVYVFTPKNDILDLKIGATPLDAAYQIHSEVGHQCSGAKVNKKIVALTHKLKTGDVVEILTSKNHVPSRDWLNKDHGYLSTKAAIQKVKSWFHRHDIEAKLTKGLQDWEKTAKRLQLSKNDLTQALQYFNFKTTDDLLIALGSGHIGIQAILRQLRPKNDPVKTASITLKKATQTIAKGITISGTDNLLTQLACCCRPIPGDQITGYLTKGNGVTVHRSNCKNIARSRQKKPERILDVSWGYDTRTYYPVSIIINAYERQGLIRDISNIFVNEKTRLLELNTHVDKRLSICHIYLTLEISDIKSLERNFNQIKKLPGINEVYRKK